MADAIIVLDGDDDDVSLLPLPSSSASPCQPEAGHAPPSSANQTQKAGRLQAENDKRFAEFVEHCSTVIPEPEVLNYLRTRHAKASPDFLSSVEFRNTLERCYNRARKNISKIYVVINELCTVLKQRSAKRKLRAVKVESGPCNLMAARQSTGNGQPKAEMDGEGGAQSTEGNEASTSSVHEAGVNVKEEDEEAEKKKRRASQKQIAYLENLLRLYNEEIRRLQLTELSLDDLASEDSLHIQEHKLKRKMMKIYEKLCELKSCDTLTGRVIEQRIRYTATRYPEINKKIERYINSPEVRDNPPDYQDINRLVTNANEHYKLNLDRKHLNMLAKEAFRDIGTRIQERRHLDLVFNFGSHLTDAYKPAEDPALSDPALLRKLKANREESLSRLEEVISKFALKQEDTEEQERNKRQQKTDQKLKNENANGVNQGKAVEEEEEEDEGDEEDESSDPDIEEEIQASIQQATPDDDDDEETDCSPADVANQEDGGEGPPASGHHGEADCVKNGGEASGPGFSPLSAGSNTDSTPPPAPSPSASPAEEGDQQQVAPPLANGSPAESVEKAADPSSQATAAPVSSSSSSSSSSNSNSSSSSSNDEAVNPEVASSSWSCQVKSSSTSPPPFPQSSLKRKRKEAEASTTQRPLAINDSEVDIPLDMGVFACSSPEGSAEELVSSTQLTPPPKKNKVNVSTQCDPVEVIVLSDSE